MLRIIWAAIILLSLAGPTPAFFLFLCPAPSPEAQLKLTAGDRLNADEKLNAEVFSGAKVEFLAPDGTRTPADLGTKAGAKLDPTRAAAVLATAEYGVVTRGGPAVFVVHHAKFVAVPSENPPLGNQPLEITPVRSGSQVSFRVTARGTPKPGVDVAVWVPGEKAARAVKTDANGTTPAFAPAGDYSARCTATEAQEGEFVGRKYTHVRHHATLVTAVRP